MNKFYVLGMSIETTIIELNQEDLLSIEEAQETQKELKEKGLIVNIYEVTIKEVIDDATIKTN
jgi:hypothetical protein